MLTQQRMSAGAAGAWPAAMLHSSSIGFLQPVTLPLPRISRQLYAAAASRIQRPPINFRSNGVERSQRLQQRCPLCLLAAQGWHDQCPLVLELVQALLDGAD